MHRLAAPMTLLALFAPGCAIYCPVYATSGCVEVAKLDGLGAQGRHEALIGYLDDERSWVREEAAKALGRHHVRAAQPALRARLNDGSERRYVRAEAARALGRLGARDTTSDLRAAARADAAPELKLAVLEALCTMDPAGPDTQAMVQGLVTDEDVLVASAAKHRQGTGCGS